METASCNRWQKIFAKYCRFQPDIFSFGKVQEVARYGHLQDPNTLIDNVQDIVYLFYVQDIVYFRSLTIE